MAEPSKTYDPKTVEPKWYQRWIDNRDFEADATSKKKPFSIVMPPPNITGVLTLGHVLNNAIQDILARRARMRGFEVLWLPGMDHAGIGTQTAVEKWLRKNEGITRQDLGRENFWKLRPRVRKQSWPTPGSRFIRRTNDMRILLAKKCGVRCHARKFRWSPMKRSIPNSAPAF